MIRSSSTIPSRHFPGVVPPAEYSAAIRRHLASDPGTGLAGVEEFPVTTANYQPHDTCLPERPLHGADAGTRFSVRHGQARTLLTQTLQPSFKPVEEARLIRDVFSLSAMAITDATRHHIEATFRDDSHVEMNGFQARRTWCRMSFGTIPGHITLRVGQGQESGCGNAPDNRRTS